MSAKENTQDQPLNKTQSFLKKLQKQGFIRVIDHNELERRAEIYAFMEEQAKKSSTTDKQ